MKTNSLHGYQAEVLLKIKLPKGTKKKEHKPSTQLLLPRARVNCSQAEVPLTQRNWLARACGQIQDRDDASSPPPLPVPEGPHLSDNIEDNICEPEPGYCGHCLFPRFVLPVCLKRDTMLCVAEALSKCFPQPKGLKD